MALMSTPSAAAAPTDRVLLRVPADPAYLAVLRTATAGVAARIGLTLDEIEDLRVAVDEACALLLSCPRRRGDELTAAFDLQAPHMLLITITGPAGRLPDRGVFAWSVLEALAGRVETGPTPQGGSWIRLLHLGGRRA